MITEEEIILKLNMIKNEKFGNGPIFHDGENKFIKFEGKIGACASINTKEKFLDKLEGIEIKTIQSISGETLLAILTENLTDNFSIIVLDFLRYFNEDKNKDPQEWVDRWKNLIGNKNTEEMAYDLLGELVVLNKLLEKNINVKLTPNGTFDIESDYKLFEVKTSKLKHGEKIIVNSEHQFQKTDERKIFLEYVKIEQSNQGESISSIIKKLDKNGYDILSIKSKFENFSTSAINKTYRIIEVREYEINENFPLITNDSFVDGKLPKGIIKINYEVDLTGLEYVNI